MAEVRSFLKQQIVCNTLFLTCDDLEKHKARRGRSLTSLSTTTAGSVIHSTLLLSCSVSLRDVDKTLLTEFIL